MKFLRWVWIKKNFTNNRLTFEWFNASNIVAYLAWSLSTYVGALLGSFIFNPNKLGLDFALVAMFIGLLYLQIIADDSLDKKLQVIMCLLTFVMVFVEMIFIPVKILVLVVTLIGCGIGVALKHAFS